MNDEYQTYQYWNNMKKQLINEEFRRMQQLAGIKLNENKTTNLLQFIKNNKDEIAQILDFTHLKDISIDNMGDVGAIGIYLDDEDPTREGESGLAFRFPEDVDGGFYGESGDKPRPITIAGQNLMYVGYNI
jgi:hypothetical protein